MELITRMGIEFRESAGFCYSAGMRWDGMGSGMGTDRREMAVCIDGTKNIDSLKSSAPQISKRQDATAASVHCSCPHSLFFKWLRSKVFLDQSVFESLSNLSFALETWLEEGGVSDS